MGHTDEGRASGQVTGGGERRDGNSTAHPQGRGSSQDNSDMLLPDFPIFPREDRQLDIYVKPPILKNVSNYNLLRGRPKPGHRQKTAHKLP